MGALQKGAHPFSSHRIDCGSKQKGVSFLAAVGYIQVRAYTSRAQFPLEDVSIILTDPEGTVLAMAVTDRSGRIVPISLPVPDLAESQTPDPPEKPYTTVNLYARKKGFELVEARDLQLFAGTTTLQNLELIPLAELPDRFDQSVVYNTAPQNL